MDLRELVQALSACSSAKHSNSNALKAQCWPDSYAGTSYWADDLRPVSELGARPVLLCLLN